VHTILQVKFYVLVVVQELDCLTELQQEADLFSRHRLTHERENRYYRIPALSPGNFEQRIRGDDFSLSSGKNLIFMNSHSGLEDGIIRVSSQQYFDIFVELLEHSLQIAKRQEGTRLEKLVKARLQVLAVTFIEKIVVETSEGETKNCHLIRKWYVRHAGVCLNKEACLDGVGPKRLSQPLPGGKIRDMLVDDWRNHFVVRRHEALRIAAKTTDY